MQHYYQGVSFLIKFRSYQVNKILFKSFRYNFSSSKSNKQKEAKSFNSKAKSPMKTINLQSQAKNAIKKSLQLKQQTQKQQENCVSQKEQKKFKGAANVILQSNQIMTKSNLYRLIGCFFVLPIALPSTILKVVCSTTFVQVVFQKYGIITNILDIFVVMLWIKMLLENIIRYLLRIITKIQTFSSNFIVFKYQFRFKAAEKIVQSTRVQWDLDQEDLKFQFLSHWVYQLLVKLKIFGKNKLAFQKDRGIWCLVNGKLFWVSSTASINPQLKHLLKKMTPQINKFVQNENGFHKFKKLKQKYDCQRKYLDGKNDLSKY